MTFLTIQDLTANKELDHEAMTEISGGFWGSHFSILSPRLFNHVTPIDGYAVVPTEQTNNLAQIDYTVVENGDGAQGVSNNKAAYQGNSNYVGYILSPHVGHGFRA